MICKHSGVRIPDRASLGLEAQANALLNNAEEETGLRIPEGMMRCINQIAETSEPTSTAPNVEFTTKFAESLMQDASSKDVAKHTDLSTHPSSWTDFLLSPTKESSSKDGKQSGNEAFFKGDQTLSGSQKDITDLDESTAAVREMKSVPDDDCNRKWFIPDDLPIDLRVKTALCLIELKIPCNIQVS